MSKGSSNSNNSGSMDSTFISKIIEDYSSQAKDLSEMSDILRNNNALNKQLVDIFKEFNKIAAKDRKTKDYEKVVKDVLGAVNRILDVDYNVKANASQMKNVTQEFVREAASALKATSKALNTQKGQDRFTTTVKNFAFQGIFESMRYEESKGKRGRNFYSGTMENDKLSKFYTDIANKLGIKIDSIQYKLVNFFTTVQDKTLKAIKQLGTDLIEGLEKSKWVGGALRDTFRLLGLLGANWLSQFGQLGKILGGALYVAMETAGPLLVKLLLQGLGKLFLKLPGLIGNLGKGLWNTALKVSTKAGGPLADLATAPKGQRLAAGGRLLGAGLVAGAAFAGATYATKEGVDSWKQGRKGNAAAFAGGALALVGGGIAVILAGVTAPITLTLLGIGAAVVGIAAIWKHHSETIKKWAKTFGHFVNKVIDFMALWNPVFKAIAWIRDYIAEKLGINKGGGSVAGNNANKGTGITDSIVDNKKGNYVSYGKMKVSKRDGSILNLNELTQDEASEALQMYEKADPTSFNRVYEWIEGDKANLNSHSTDAVKKVNGNKVAALSKKGTSKEIDDLRSMLEGMSPEKAAEFVQTSGKLTGSNEFHGIGGWKSHNNQYGLGIDLAGGESWTGADYERNLPVLRKYYEARGYEVELERPGQGKSTGWHYDIKPKTNMRPEGARENFDNYEKAQALNTTAKMMSISDVVKTLSEDELRTYNEKFDKKNPKTDKEKVELGEKILKDMGIYTSTKEPGSPWVRKDKNGNESLLKDATGNYMYSEQYMQKLANGGAN